MSRIQTAHDAVRMHLRNKPLHAASAAYAWLVARNGFENSRAVRDLLGLSDVRCFFDRWCNICESRHCGASLLYRNDVGAPIAVETVHLNHDGALYSDCRFKRFVVPRGDAAHGTFWLRGRHVLGADGKGLMNMQGDCLVVSDLETGLRAADRGSWPLILVSPYRAPELVVVPRGWRHRIIPDEEGFRQTLNSDPNPNCHSMVTDAAAPPPTGACNAMDAAGASPGLCARPVSDAPACPSSPSAAGPNSDTGQPGGHEAERAAQHESMGDADLQWWQR